MEKTTPTAAIAAAVAAGGLGITEALRRIVPQPPQATGAALVYWFTDHVFFDGKFLCLLAMAAAPLLPAPRVSASWLIAGAAMSLMLASLMSLSHPLWLLFCALTFGLAFRQAGFFSGPIPDKAGILMTIAGMGLGVPLNSFSGLMAAKMQFQAGPVEQLFGSTAAMGSIAIATAYLGLILLGSKYFLKSR